MGKYLLLLVLVFAVIYFVRGYGRRRVKPRADEAPPRSAEDMVRCVHCGVHLPRSESLLAGGRSFCSREHERLYRP